MTDKWRYSADYMLACNCDYGCPCNFNARPSRGNCEGVISVRIRDGAYGKTRLKGGKAAIAAWWPGAIHEGGGIMQLYVDGKSEAQREALVKIFSGEAGRMPWALFAKTYKVLPPKTSKIDVEVKGKKSRLKVGDVLNVEVEAVRNPVTKDETFFDIVIAKPLAVKRMSVFSSAKNEMREAADPHLSWSVSGRHVGTATVSHRGP